MEIKNDSLKETIPENVVGTKTIDIGRFFLNIPKSLRETDQFAKNWTNITSLIKAHSYPVLIQEVVQTLQRIIENISLDNQSKLTLVERYSTNLKGYLETTPKEKIEKDLFKKEIVQKIKYNIDEEQLKKIRPKYLFKHNCANWVSTVLGLQTSGKTVWKGNIPLLENKSLLWVPNLPDILANVLGTKIITDPENIHAKMTNPKPGTLVIFSGTYAGETDHIGIIGSNGKLFEFYHKEVRENRLDVKKLSDPALIEKRKPMIAALEKNNKSMNLPIVSGLIEVA